MSAVQVRLPPHRIKGKKFSIITEGENAGGINQQQNLENCITSKKEAKLFLVREK
jgi:hypothetical protein